MSKGTYQRRSFLKLLSAAPLAARGVAGKALDALVVGGNVSPVLSNLSGVVSEAGNGILGGATQGQTSQQFTNLTKAAAQDILRKAIQKPETRREIEAILYEDHRQVFALDPDLLYNRSISPAAKIVFQRQRLVARALDYEISQKETTWNRLRNKIQNILFPSVFQ